MQTMNECTRIHATILTSTKDILWQCAINISSISKLWTDTQYYTIQKLLYIVWYRNSSVSVMYVVVSAVHKMPILRIISDRHTCHLLPSNGDKKNAMHVATGTRPAAACRTADIHISSKPWLLKFIDSATEQMWRCWHIHKKCGKDLYWRYLRQTTISTYC